MRGENGGVFVVRAPANGIGAAIKGDHRDARCGRDVRGSGIDRDKEIREPEKRCEVAQARLSAKVCDGNRHGRDEIVRVTAVFFGADDVERCVIFERQFGDNLDEVPFRPIAEG